MAQSIEVKVPDIGGFANVDVIEVLVAAGQNVEADTPLVTLETEKATMDVPSSAAGVDSAVNSNSGNSTNSSDIGTTSNNTATTERSLSALAAGNAPFLSDGAPPDNHPDLNELAKIKVLSEMKELPDGSRKYVFHFPKDFSIGRLGVWGPRCPDSKLEAKGEQEYPPWAKVLFQPYDFFTADPQNFDKFGPETLDELDFTRRQNVNTKTLETASRITSIKTLKLSQTGIDASSLAMLDKFKKLQEQTVIFLSFYAVRSVPTFSPCKARVKNPGSSAEKICTVNPSFFWMSTPSQMPVSRTRARTVFGRRRSRSLMLGTNSTIQTGSPSSIPAPGSTC